MSNRQNINSYMQRGLLSVLSAMSFMALTLTVGCGEKVAEPRIKDPETEPTQISIDLTSIESKDGNRTYIMETRRMERFELAEEPYSLFKEGIKVQTFNDTTQMIESELVADYAHYNEVAKLWEARGNVVARNFAGQRTLYSEQLWWNETTHRIYSDTVVKVIEKNNTHIGVGFEADEAFTSWIFRRPRGQMEMGVNSDTTAVEETPVDELPEPDTEPVVHQPLLRDGVSSARR